MSKKFMRKLDRMGRRRFLNTLGGLGLSATTLSFITKDALAETTSDVTEEVPYVKFLRHTNPEEIERGAVPEREPIWDTIPRSKWVRVESAHDAARNLNDSLDRQFSSGQVVASVTSRNGDPYQKEISVKYTTVEHADGTVSSPAASFSQVENALPNTVSGQAGEGRNAETVRGIPVTITRERKIEQSCSGGEYNSEHGSDIPGGTRIGDSGSTGTAGMAATRDSDGQNVMVSCGHVLDNSTHFHQPGDQKSEEDLYVEAYDNTDSNDNGYAIPYDNETFVRELADGSGGVKYTDVKGVVSWDTIKNNEGDDTYVVKKQGNRTGTTKGYIIDTVEKSTGERNFWTNADSGGGDSGGPHFNRVQWNGNDETYIVGIHAWGRGSDSCPTPESGGNSMEYIEENWGLTV